MSNILQKLKKMMKIGVVVDSDDSGSYPIIFAKYMGKLKSRALNFTPFGLWSRPPDGSMALLFNVNASESNKFAISNVLKDRPDINKGEVLTGNLLSYFHFKEDGNITLVLAAGKSLTVEGDFNINGNLVVDGTITATGIIEGSDLTDGSVPYAAHKHSDPQGGVTGPPQ